MKIKKQIKNLNLIYKFKKGIFPSKKLFIMFKAKMEAQRRGSWLFVNMQDTQEFESQILNRDIWSNTGVKEIMKTFVFWQVRLVFHLYSYC